MVIDDVNFPTRRNREVQIFHFFDKKTDTWEAAQRILD